MPRTRICDKPNPFQRKRRTGICGDKSLIPQAFPQKNESRPYPFLRSNAQMACGRGQTRRPASLIPADLGTPICLGRLKSGRCVPISALNGPQSEPESAYTRLRAQERPCRTRFCGVPKSACQGDREQNVPKRTYFCVSKPGTSHAVRTQFCERFSVNHAGETYTCPPRRDVYVEQAHTW